MTDEPMPDPTSAPSADDVHTPAEVAVQGVRCVRSLQHGWRQWHKITDEGRRVPVDGDGNWFLDEIVRLNARLASIPEDRRDRDYNTISREEAAALRFALDDADFLCQQSRENERILTRLWRRLHLWLIGDDTARVCLSSEFPDFAARPSEETR